MKKLVLKDSKKENNKFYEIIHKNKGKIAELDNIINVYEYLESNVKRQYENLLTDLIANLTRNSNRYFVIECFEVWVIDYRKNTKNNSTRKEVNFGEFQEKDNSIFAFNKFTQIKVRQIELTEAIDSEEITINKIRNWITYYKKMDYRDNKIMQKVKNKYPDIHIKILKKHLQDISSNKFHFSFKQENKYIKPSEKIILDI